MYHPARVALKATSATRRLIDLRKLDATIAACKKLGEAHVQVWEASDPRLFKKSVALSEYADRLKEFAAARDKSAGGLDQEETPQLRALLLALVLLRADSKKEALTMTIEALAPQLPQLPTALARLCIARSASLLPHHAEALSPFKTGETRIYNCQLGLSTTFKKDERRVPVALDEALWLRAAAPVPAQDSVFLSAKPVKREVFEVSPFCKLGNEWVMVTDGEIPRGVHGVCLLRGLFGSQKAAHEEGATLVPHIMMPEGSTGVTELFARLLVAFAQNPEAWGHYKPFRWLYPQGTQASPAVPDDEQRGPKEYLFAWFAAAARQCQVAASSGVPTPEDKERVKYMLTHMHPFLQVAGKELVEVYPAQTKKVALALQSSNLVKDVLASSKGQQPPTLVTLLEVIASNLDVDARVQKLEDLRAQAEAAESSSGATGELAAVVLLLESGCAGLKEEVQQMLNNVAIAKVGNNITGIKRLVEKKVGLLGRTLCLEPLPTDEGEQGNRGVMALRAGYGEAQAAQLRDLLRAKLAERLVKTVVQINEKMFTFKGGFEGYAWAAVLTSLASKSEEGVLLIKWILHLIHWEMPHVEATSEPESRIVTSGQAESKGVVNLFAAIIQSEELPIGAAADLAETLIGKGKGTEVTQRCSIVLPDQTPLTNSAALLRMWFEAFCGKPGLKDAVCRLGISDEEKEDAGCSD